MTTTNDSGSRGFRQDVNMTANTDDFNGGWRVNWLDLHRITPTINMAILCWRDAELLGQADWLTLQWEHWYACLNWCILSSYETLQGKAICQSRTEWDEYHVLGFPESLVFLANNWHCIAQCSQPSPTLVHSTNSIVILSVIQQKRHCLIQATPITNYLA